MKPNSKPKPAKIHRRHVRLGWRAGREKQVLLENLSLLIDAGVGIQGALDSIKQEVRSKHLKDILKNMQDDIDNGQNFSATLSTSGLLPEYVVSLVKIGEESGQLSKNLQVVIKQQEKDRSFRSKLRSAMIYPAIVLGLTVAVGGGIAWFLLPRLAELFTDLRVPLPLPTRVMLAFGNLLQTRGLWILAGLVLAVLAFVITYLTMPKMRQIPLKIMLLIPGFHKLVMHIELARFGYITGNLLEAGLPIVETFETLARASRIAGYKRVYEKMASSIQDGDSFRTMFAKDKKIGKYIPLPIQELVVAGEQSGNLAKTLKHLGNIYEDKIDILSKNLATLVEPILLVIVWFMVVGVALAVILPIYKIIGGLDQ